MKENKKDYMVITVCPICKHINLTFVNAEDYWSWQEGELVQNAFPYLSANEREALKTGICAECWDKMFSFDDDDEEESEEDYEPEEFDYDFRDEIGFNPYMGCYDFDC